MSSEWRPRCPECGGELSLFFERDKKTRKVKIQIGCEGDASDEFIIEISTGLSEEDLEGLKKSKPIKMVGRLVERESDPELEDEES